VDGLGGGSRQAVTPELTWSDLDPPIIGNNGPIRRHYDLVEAKTFYRIRWAPTT
jgi:beta-N-acetylglucosaminidase